MKSISVINFKGGVGKTTITYLIGNYLASKEKKVLLCDIDPQMSLTQIFAFQKKYQQNFLHIINNSDITTSTTKNSISNLAQLLQYYIRNEKTFPIKVNNKAFIGLEEHLSIIPSSNDLYGVEFATKYDDVTKSFFQELIPKIPKKYKSNYILFDCPPNFTPFTYSALYTSDVFIIPVQPDLFGPRAFTAIYNFIEFNSNLNRNKKTKYLILFNKVRTTYLKKTTDECTNAIINVKERADQKPNVKILTTRLFDRAYFRKALQTPSLSNEVINDLRPLWDEIEKEL